MNEELEIILENLLSRNDFLWICLAPILETSFSLSLDQAIMNRASSLSQLIDDRPITGVKNVSELKFIKSTNLKKDPSLLIVHGQLISIEPLSNFKQIIAIDSGLNSIILPTELDLFYNEQVFFNHDFSIMKKRTKPVRFYHKGLADEVHIYGYKRGSNGSV